MLSQAPSRCVPILCLDASGRVGQGESEPCIGPDHQAVENYNGRKLRELLSAQAMAAVNTFSQLATLSTDSLATTVELTMFAFHKPYWAELRLAKSFLLQANVYKSFLQLEKKDHMPLQCSFWHKLAYDIFTPAFQWDQDALAQGVLQGHRRARLLQTCEQALPQTDLHEHRNSSPDAVWNIINTAVVEAAQACYKQKNKHATDPANTKNANEKMVVARATLAHLPRPRRFSAICQTSVSIDFLSALLQQWRGLAQYWKAGNHLDHLAKPDRQKKLPTIGSFQQCLAASRLC